MLDTLADQAIGHAVPLFLLRMDELDQWLASQAPIASQWVKSNDFRAASGTLCKVPAVDGRLSAVLVGLGQGPADMWSLAGVPTQLPDGEYQLSLPTDGALAERLALGWALAGYRFGRYKEQEPPGARLVLPPGTSPRSARLLADATAYVRDLINTPAEDMGPDALADEARVLARRFGADLRTVEGDDLIVENFPLIHAVGRAATRAPRLLDLTWGNPIHPRVTLVGKGVCFDTGGLDIKPSSGMRLMKKDMGGAAHVLGLGRLIMGAALPVRLRVLVPAVENAVAGNAFRPGDVFRGRNGLTVEIDNTDAEGRLVLADALALAAEEQPEVLLDFATLTGAARVALGTDLPALFSNDDALADGLLRAGVAENDALWRMPLHSTYRELLDSRIADIANGSSQPYAGAITAALFLKAFVPDKQVWAHVDLMAWNNRSRPGRPEGGEAMGLRAAFAYLSTRFSQLG